MPMARVQFERVQVVFGTATDGLVAVQHFDLVVEPGQVVSFVGSSGCGKTTLLRLAAGVLEPSQGRVLINGRDARAAKDAGVVVPALVQQEFALFPWLTTHENVALPFKVLGKTPDAELVDRLLDAVGLLAFADRPPRELSGGMKARAAVARALVAVQLAGAGNAVLLMDECFGQLDELTREALAFELQHHLDRWPATTLFVTHNVAEAVLVADRVVVLTPRPASVKADIPVGFGRPRRPSLLTNTAFIELVATIRSALGILDGDVHGETRAGRRGT